MDGKTTGIVCPSCGRRMEYHYTKHRMGHVKRSRICQNCGIQVITREEIRVIVVIQTDSNKPRAEID